MSIYNFKPQNTTLPPSASHATKKLTENTVNLGWRAHQLAVEIADADPNAVTQTLRRAATEQWRRAFLDLPR